MRKARTPGVYVLTFSNGEFYVGSSRHPRGRFTNIRALGRKNKLNGQPRLQEAFLSFGDPTFKQLFVCRPCDLLFYEQRAIDVLKPTLQGKYAITGFAWKGLKHKEETKIKMREAHIGSSASEEAKRKISAANSGKTFSVESKMKMRLAKLGKKHTEEARKNMSLGQLKRYGKI